MEGIVKGNQVLAIGRKRTDCHRLAGQQILVCNF